MTTPFAQYVDGMMGERPILNQPLQLASFYLMTYLASHTDGNLLEPCDTIERDFSLMGGRIDVTNQEVEHLEHRVIDLEGKLVKLAAVTNTNTHFKDNSSMPRYS